MHIETLKVFCDLAETGSFSLAATKNFVTQSAVSQQVRSLETRYGQKLIERSKGNVRLTPAGEVLYQAGKEIIQKYQEIEDNLQTSSRTVAGVVRVATVYSVGLYEISSPLKKFLRTFPDVNVHLEYTRVNKIYEDVSKGNLDLGIVAYPTKHPQITVIPFREDRLVLICSPHHPFARHKRISIKKLDGEKLVGFERDIPTRRAVDRVLRKHAVKAQYVMEMDNIETIKRGVEIDSGISIVPELAVQQEVKNETLRALSFTEEILMRPLGIICKRGRDLTPAVEEFIRLFTNRGTRQRLQ
jgi:molybdate transport repressor ModE-like protein